MLGVLLLVQISLGMYSGELGRREDDIVSID